MHHALLWLKANKKKVLIAGGIVAGAVILIAWRRGKIQLWPL